MHWQRRREKIGTQKFFDECDAHKIKDGLCSSGILENMGLDLGQVLNWEREIVYREQLNRGEPRLLRKEDRRVENYSLRSSHGGRIAQSHQQIIEVPGYLPAFAVYGREIRFATETWDFQKYLRIIGDRENKNIKKLQFRFCGTLKIIEKHSLVYSILENAVFLRDITRLT